jgi:hypothetical protein
MTQIVDLRGKDSQEIFDYINSYPNQLAIVGKDKPSNALLDVFVSELEWYGYDNRQDWIYTGGGCDYLYYVWFKFGEMFVVRYDKLEKELYVYNVQINRGLRPTMDEVEKGYDLGVYDPDPIQRAFAFFQVLFDFRKEHDPAPTSEELDNYDNLRDEVLDLLGENGYDTEKKIINFFRTVISEVQETWVDG